MQDANRSPNSNRIRSICLHESSLLTLTDGLKHYEQLHLHDSFYVIPIHYYFKQHRLINLSAGVGATLLVTLKFQDF